MADKPHAPAPRVGRPRTKSAHQTPHAPAPKVSRPRSKSVHQTKTKEPKKNPPKPNPMKVTPPLEPRVIVVNSVDQPEKQVPLHPPMQPDQLPDIPSNQLDQLPNNPPNQQPNPPAGQPNQPPNPPANPPDQLPNPPPNHPPNPPANTPNPMANPPHQAPHLNLSYIKPEFSGKPEEDVVAHLLRTNDLMEMQDFPDGAKVRRFCLTLTGKARLWYETLRSIHIGCEALQECFRQQYSKFGSTREQYFHVWRSFHYDEIQILSILI